MFSVVPNASSLPTPQTARKVGFPCDDDCVIEQWYHVRRRITSQAIVKKGPMKTATNSFREEYGFLRSIRGAVEESRPPFHEHVLQCVWLDQLFDQHKLFTDDGRPVRILAPGWWNHGEGPDFRGAEVEIGGKLKTGDVEIHLDHGAWKQHGHHLDPRYDEVILVAVLEMEPPRQPPVTHAGRRVPCLLLSHYIEGDLNHLADRLTGDDYPYDAPGSFGDCSELIRAHGYDRIETLLNLAGEWRMLNKATALRERLERVGVEQAFYESFMSACGYSRYKHAFRVIAQQLPYDRVRQLAKHDPLLLEAAFLQMAGLMPDTPPLEEAGASHHARLETLRQDHLSGLKSIPLAWRRLDVRPINYPERRLAGAAAVLSRTAATGLLEAFESVWRKEMSPISRRKAFEEVFPLPHGFWANHCTWDSKTMARPVSLLGPGRIRGILGNVLVPMALAQARRSRDRSREERVFAFFAKLPAEPDNRVIKRMAPRLFGDAPPPRMDFRMQQGVLQLFYDWCEPNPSCRTCPVVPYVATETNSTP